MFSVHMHVLVFQNQFHCNECIHGISHYCQDFHNALEIYIFEKSLEIEETSLGECNPKSSQ